ncbi:MAG TPA: MlaD family protein [Solirubrobacteraceae bacterium]|jgi:virulence factor Mce-like protein|nr:MlaD family protein [Solirubrobacteraceae bacterium]
MKGLIRFLAELAHPKRAARSIPLGRLAIASMFAFVLLFVIFTLRSMGVQLPFVSHPYTIYAEMDSADGLDAADGPQVSVAGVPDGEVTGVRYDAGRARVTMQLSGSVAGKLFRNASVRVRPFNAANFLEVDITPGTPSAGRLPAGATLDLTRTSIPVATDQVLDVLNADTRAYLQLLTEQAAIALHGTGGVLAGALARLDPLSSQARRLGDMLRQRSTLIGRLVAETNVIFTTLGARHAELASMIGSASRLLAVTAARDAQLQTATEQLPGVLTQATSTTGALATLAPTLQQALQRFGPAARAFATGLRQTGATAPALQRFLTALASLEHGTLTPSRELSAIAGQLGSGIGPAVAGYKTFGTIIDSVVAHQRSIANSSDALSGVFSTEDVYGPLARVRLLGIEPPNAQDLGLTPAAARPGADGYSTLDTMLGAALRALCQRQALACVLAAGTPGLPNSIVPASRGVRPVQHDRTPAILEAPR